MAHEKSVTRQLKSGRWANFGSVPGNKGMLGGKTFPTSKSAVAAAKKRSDNFRTDQRGKPKNKPTKRKSKKG